MIVDTRPARFDDVFRIEETLLKAAELAEFPVPDVERPYAYQKMMDLIARGLVWVAVAQEDHTPLVGVLMLNAHHWPWTRQEWHFTNEHFWVEPKYRKGGTAAKLLAHAKECALQAGKVLILDLTFGGIDTEPKDRFVKMQGFAYKGGRFCFDPHSPRLSSTRPSSCSSLAAAE